MKRVGGNHGGGRSLLGSEEQYAMTHEEIARVIGSSRKAVAMVQNSALRKLRARPGLFKQFRELVEMRASLRHREDHCA